MHTHMHIYMLTHTTQHKHIDTLLDTHWQDTDLHAHVQVETCVCSHNYAHRHRCIYELTGARTPTCTSHILDICLHIQLLISTILYTRRILIEFLSNLIS